MTFERDHLDCRFEMLVNHIIVALRYLGDGEPGTVDKHLRSRRIDVAAQFRGMR